VALIPVAKVPLRSFWSTGPGWGSFHVDAAAVSVAIRLAEEVRITPGEEIRLSWGSA
jgi:hypothetical protein